MYTHTYIHTYTSIRTDWHLPQTGAWIVPTTFEPSYAYGWGYLSLATALSMSDSDFKLHARQDLSLAKGQFIDLCFNVQSAAKAFRTTIVWTDPPGDLSSPLTLVNNLVSVCA